MLSQTFSLPISERFPEATYTGCVTLGSPTILHCFPAHETELRDVHRDELDKIALLVRSGDASGRTIRRIRIVGHAATWRGLSRAQYVSRAIDRAKAARSYLRGRLSGYMLSRRPRIVIEGRADDEPLVDNRVSSSSSSARRNREINRRVEIFLTGPKPRPRPRRRDRPVPTDWEAFLDTKLRKLTAHWEVSRPFRENFVSTCVLRKLGQKRTQDNVVEPMGTRGALPARDPITWTNLREDLISDLKKGYARGAIKNFERQFDMRVDNLWTAVRQLGFRATGAEIYNTAVTSEWRRVVRLSKRRNHLYSCKVIRDHIRSVVD